MNADAAWRKAMRSRVIGPASGRVGKSDHAPQFLLAAYFREGGDDIVMHMIDGG